MTDEELIEKLAETMFQGSAYNARMLARAILPIIKAERVRGGEMVKEAAAKHCEQWSSQYRKAHKNAHARKQRQEARDFESMEIASAFRAFEIRALSVPAIVEAGDGDL